MKWQGRRGSSNVEDRRGMGGGGKVIGGGIGGIIIVVIVTLLSGGNARDILGGLTSGVFQEEGKTYQDPTLVLYTGSVDSACGTATSAVGPFYCPGDAKLYIDLSFYDELQQRFQAPGDFAMAYVIAHEVGHHVQTLLGTTEKLDSVRQSLSEKEYNKYQVRFELQADYLAGVWAKHAQGMNLLEEGDLDEALTAASAVGDDTIQKQAQGYAVPDSFTHGTSEQRKRWFYKGFHSGTIEGGDTFNATEL
ncbi:neutral zinc metallopeptidase [Paenibacillus sp. P32E]|uniref:KPN_02809 family neutral zinc metallopeptidase n=1 Tax=Paenibacillus sp. P32E TaxID=1349434 RepID=UPI0009401CC8|nr:neutral zinc metallopeptidase [Paenibacillus sp. P32E]OKP87603.1 metalloprotease [Paenibacillus sp. P32E]